MTVWPFPPKIKTEKYCAFQQKPASNSGMPITSKQANQPIFDRLGRNGSKPAPAASQKSSIDAEADEIRKTWIENTPIRPKKERPSSPGL